MARPGVEVVTRTAPPSRGAPTDTGVAFFAGLTEKGPSNVATLLHNLGDFTKYYGDRPLGMILYDACDLAFRKGCTGIWVGRAVGPAAAVDTHTFNDAGAAPSVAVDTIGPGSSGLSVAVEVGSVGGTFIFVITDDTDAVVEQSRNLLSPADAVVWGQTSAYVRVRAVGANNPAVTAAAALAGGTDDRVNVTDAQRAAALNLFPKGLGPGQVAYPGATTSVMHAALFNHAQANNRFALVDPQDTPSATTLEAEADGDRAEGTLLALAETYGMIAGAPWHVVRGVTGGTTRTIPPSAVTAGLIAQSDYRTGNPNVPAAGANGDSSDVTLALSQPGWTDDVREALNDKGVNVTRELYGGFRLYGFRTLADPADPDASAYLSAGAARARMAIVTETEAYAEQFVFAQIDGQGQTIARFKGGLIGILQKFWTLGALFGPTAADAFVVDTGPTVNTPDTLANNELHAVIGLRMSPFAELVYIEVVKVPSNQTL